MNEHERLLRKRPGFTLLIALSFLAMSSTVSPSYASHLESTIQTTQTMDVPTVDSGAPPPAVPNSSASSVPTTDTSTPTDADFHGESSLKHRKNAERDKPPKIGHSRDSITVDGIKRRFALHIPKSFTKEKLVPLVIVLHGGGGDAHSAEWDSVMSKQSEKDNFVVAYPNGFMRTWNAGQCCGIARLQNINDVEFIRQLITKLESELGVDPDRIYVAGLSNGGMMTYRIASELADVVAAVAPVEGCMYEQESSSTSPISVIAFHGIEDNIVKYNGGIGWLCGYSLKATPVAPTIEYWTKRNQCDSTPIREEKGNLIKELYTNGKNGTEVCLYTLKDGGHAWPGGRRASVFFDKPRKYISATEVMCQFFWAHPRKKPQADAQRVQADAPTSHHWR